MVSFQTAKEMLAFISPYDYERTLQYGFSAWMERDLWHWVEHDRYFDNTYIRDLVKNGERDSRTDREKKAAMAKYFEANPELYWRFLTEKRIIDLPDLWRNEYRLTLSRAVQLLTPIPPPRGIVFGLGNAYNNREYTNAIKILQDKIGCELTGFYDQGTAIGVYREKGIFIPKGRGYFAHEVNPDLLFDRRYELQVYGVDMDLWRGMQFFYQDLTRDSNLNYWNNPPVSSAVHDPINFAKILGENQGEILGISGSAFSHAGDFIDEKTKIWDEATQGKLVKAYDMSGKVLDGLSTVMEITEPIQEYVEMRYDDRAQLAYDVSIQAAQVTAKKYLGKKIVKIAIKVIKLGNPVVYVIAGVFLDDEIDKALDKYIFENEALKEFLTDRVLEPLLEFMEPLNEEWRRQHEEDLNNGIRMD